jgi:cytochrome c peroxidase
VSPGFFHNGAFVRLEDAIRHHLNVTKSDLTYDPAKAGVPADLRHRVGPAAPVLARLDPILQTPIVLTDGEFNDLVSFVRNGLLDQRVSAENLCKLVPAGYRADYQFFSSRLVRMMIRVMETSK